MAATKKATAKVTEITDREDKRKALSTAMAQIEKNFGAGAIMKLGENTKMEVQAVSTGSLSLTMSVCAAMSVVSVLVMLLIAKNLRRIQRKDADVLT